MSSQTGNNRIQGFARMRCEFSAGLETNTLRGGRLRRRLRRTDAEDDPQSFTSSAICVTLLYKAYSKPSVRSRRVPRLSLLHSSTERSIVVARLLPYSSQKTHKSSTKSRKSFMTRAGMDHLPCVRTLGGLHTRCNYGSYRRLSRNLEHVVLFFSSQCALPIMLNG